MLLEVHGIYWNTTQNRWHTSCADFKAGSLKVYLCSVLFKGDLKWSALYSVFYGPQQKTEINKMLALKLEYWKGQMSFCLRNKSKMEWVPKQINDGCKIIFTTLFRFKIWLKSNSILIRLFETASYISESVEVVASFLEMLASNYSDCMVISSEAWVDGAIRAVLGGRAPAWSSEPTDYGLSLQCSLQQHFFAFLQRKWRTPVLRTKYCTLWSGQHSSHKAHKNRN